MRPFMIGQRWQLYAHVKSTMSGWTRRNNDESIMKNPDAAACMRACVRTCACKRMIIAGGVNDRPFGSRGSRPRDTLVFL